jgi:hypothetical protein
MPDENISVCKNCGEVMYKASRDMCNTCFKHEDEIFQRTRNFLRANPGATIELAARFVGCSVELITDFITSGRLARAGIRKIAHECQLCCTIIYEGNICPTCEKVLLEHLNSLKKYGPSSDNKEE